MYLSLLDFYKVFNHCRVPQNWHVDKQLALWVKVQRRRHGHGKLLKDRERKLEELNFVWNIKTVFDSQWQECFQELGNFIQMNGHCRVPGKLDRKAKAVKGKQQAASGPGKNVGRA